MIENKEYKKVSFGTKSTLKRYRDDGSILYYLNEDLQPCPKHIIEKLVFYATQKCDHPFLAQKNSDHNWIKISYGETWKKVRRIASYLLRTEWNEGDTIAILSENSIEHALLALAALSIGIPYSPISPAYSLASHELDRFHHCISVLHPRLVFAQDSDRYQRSLLHVAQYFPSAEIVTAAGSKSYKSFYELLNESETDILDEVIERLSDNNIAKILFTSGSTGQPKGVINTQGMWCANLQQITQAMPFLAEKAPVLIDWLPWNHTFGGNHNFGLALYHGGTLFIDEGKPTPQGIEKTVQNLKEVAPTVYFNVPKGFEMLIPYFENDRMLRDLFFSNLNMIFYAGASLSQAVWNKLEELSVLSIGAKVPIITGLGCTESGPSAMFANWPGAYSGLLGVPVAGLKVKLSKDGDKYEARYKGPNITPGYWKHKEATENAFDEEGFYKTGDAIRFVSQNPDDGLLFDGRIAEDFKLSTGTWVNVGMLKASIISSGAPLIQDVVLTGLNRDFVGALLFLHYTACLELTGLNDGTTMEKLSQHIKIVTFLDEWLSLFNSGSAGSSTTVKKYIIATVPPSMEKGEITDKGSLNQRAVLTHRSELINTMYDEPWR